MRRAQARRALGRLRVDKRGTDNAVGRALAAVDPVTLLGAWTSFVASAPENKDVEASAVARRCRAKWRQYATPETDADDSASPARRLKFLGGGAPVPSDALAVVPVGELSLWPARARIFVLAHWAAFLVLALLLAAASYYGYLWLEARARQAALERERQGKLSRKQAEAQRRKEKAEADAEKRKVMRMQIEEDAAARKEPGWKAKAAGVKDGRSIVTASDIGAAGGGG